MSYFLICVLSLILGVLLCPIMIFLRARKCEGWDNSNMTNIIRVFAHLGAHPDDFAKMQYPDGTKPLRYVHKHEFTVMANTTHKKKNKT